MNIQKYGPSGRRGATIIAANITPYAKWDANLHTVGVVEIRAAETGDKFKIVGTQAEWEEIISKMQKAFIEMEKQNV